MDGFSLDTYHEEDPPFDVNIYFSRFITMYINHRKLSKTWRS
jgi:hypothetical protein